MKIAIWGTGAYCKDLLEYLAEVNPLFLGKGLSTINCQCYIDNADCESGKSFAGKPIIKPQAIHPDSVDVVVIAIAKYQEIFKQIRDEQLQIPKTVIYNSKYKLRFLHDLQRISSAIDFYSLPVYSNKLKIINDVESHKCDSLNMIDELAESYSIENIVAAIEELTDIDFNKRIYSSLDNTFKQANGGRCIGIYYPRFYNGGVERVISQLMPAFMELGFRIVLISEEISTDKEYQCPPDVVRIALPNRNVDRFGWYENLSEVIKKYDIGIMYFHNFSAYSIESLVIYYLRMINVASIVHVHQHYTVIKNIDLLAKAYKWASKIVVLSREDEQFWLDMGVPAKYIPNPINFSIDYIYHKKYAKRPTVLWMGRIDQEQKQIYDVVDIMAELVKMVPNACLRIIGSADKQEIMEELRLRIESAGLEDNIMLMGFFLEPWDECCDGDVMLMTSAYEGFPMALMECKMAGIPLVMYSLPYLELLKDRKGYIEVAQNDVLGAAKMLASIINDKELQVKMSKETRESIEEFSECDIKEIWGKVLSSMV